MLEDAYKEIQSLVDSNEKIHFIAFTKGGDLMLSVSDILIPITFKTIAELTLYIESI
jgi:hypothetical protein